MCSFKHLIHSFHLAYIAFALAISILFTPGCSYASLISDRAPILLVHGYGLTSSSFNTVVAPI